MKFYKMDTRTPSALFAVAFLFVLGLVLLLPQLEIYPTAWFDEGYVTHPANVLFQRGIYGTYGVQGYWPFDPLVSTGPTVILPIAVMFKVFGVGISQARIIPVLYTLLALAGLYTLARRLYGSAAALMLTLMIVALPSVADVRLLLVGRQTIGEPGALALETVGLVLLYESWRRKSSLWGVVAGIALGLGLISKLQTGFALMPALLLITLMRMIAYRKYVIKNALPLAITTGVAVGWLLVQRLGMPEALRSQASQLQADGLTTHFITGLWGHTLSTTSLAIAAVITLGGFISLLRFWNAAQKVSTGTFSERVASLGEAQWVELTLALITFCFVIWFALFSVGWPRYSFVVVTWCGLVYGKAIWDGLLLLYRRLHWSPRLAYLLLGITLVVIALLANLLPMRESQDDGLDAAAAYISHNIPKDAVIESWEWQLDASSAHWLYHHPDGETVFKGIRQYSHLNIPFNLEYDALQADPDYLVIGPYSLWTGIYDTQQVQDNFKKVDQVGDYTILERVRT